MKKKLLILMALCALLLTTAVAVLPGRSVSVQAAETEIYAADAMENAPEISLGTTYFSKMENRVGYVKFTTPAEGGYVTVYCKNISMDRCGYSVRTSIDEELKSDWDYANGSVSWEFLSEPGKRNGAELEPNTTYYIQVGSTEYSGNVMFSASFAADLNPNGKDQAEAIALNTSYTRSIDSWNKTDYDYFRFTTTKGGAHTLTLSKSGSGYYYNLGYYIRKWSTDELAKTKSGGDFSGTFYNSGGEADVMLEANTEYYLRIYGQGIQNYTISIADNSVTAISVTPSVSLTVGETYKLSPVITPDTAANKNVTYSSSDPSVAWVNSEGLITASSSVIGSTVITVTAADGSGVTATCTVSVVAAQPVTGISVPSSKKVSSGNGFQLNPTVLPGNAYNKNVSYSSSKTSVASVSSSGWVSTASCGTATITVTADDGSGVKAKCKVIVVPSKPTTPYMTCSTSTNKIEWSPVSGASGYTLYVKSGKKWKAVKTTTKTKYTRKKLKSGSKFQYRIKAYVKIGKTKYYSPYSGTCYAVTTPKAGKIRSIRHLKKQTGWYSTTYRARLYWTKSKGASGYRVYYKVPGSSSYTFYNSTTSTNMEVDFALGTSSKTRTFYVVPYITYKGVSYYTSYSKGKKYRFY